MTAVGERTHYHVIELRDVERDALVRKLREVGVEQTYDPLGQALHSIETDAPGIAVATLRNIAALDGKHAAKPNPRPLDVRAARMARDTLVVLGDTPPAHAGP